MKKFNKKPVIINRMVGGIKTLFGLVILFVIAFLLLSKPSNINSQGIGEFNCVWNETADACEAIGRCQAGTDMVFPDGSRCINRGGSFVDNKEDCEAGNPHECLGNCSPPGLFCDPNDRLNIYECKSDGTVDIAQTCTTGICIEENGTVSCKTATAPPPPGNAGGVPVKTPLGGSCGDDALDTAIGCIPITTDEAILTFFLRWAIGIAGGVAFIFIVYAGFMVITSQGNPERIQAGKQMLTAAISGIILLVFAALILDFVGVKVLGIWSQ